MVAMHQSPQNFTHAERQGLRELSFLNLAAEQLLVAPYDRSGEPPAPALKIAPLTPWRENLLWAYDSPLVTGAPFIGRLSLLQALYLLTPGFSPGLRGARIWLWLFCLRGWRLPQARTEQALRAWHRAQFIDSPPRQTEPNADPDDGPSERWLAGFVLNCMTLLKFPEADVLHTPISRLLQYLAEFSDQAAGKDRPRFNSSRDQRAKAYLAAKRGRLANPQPT
jgi:hypothetical protein